MTQMPDLKTLLRTKPFLFAALLSLVLLVANIVAEPDFGKPSNWAALLAGFAPLALVALASTPAILSGFGHLDLSIGPNAVFCNVILTVALIPHNLGSGWVAIPLIMLMGTAIGLIN